jgi:hypothetical protein
MHTHRFGRKLKLTSIAAIKHQIRHLMFEELIKKAEATARVEANRRLLADSQGQPGGSP